MKTIIKVIITGFVLVCVFGSGIVGGMVLQERASQYKVPTKSMIEDPYTGQDMVDAINQYRHNLGVQELVIDPRLNNNLTERYLDVVQPGTGHKGWEEWLISVGLKKNGRIIGYSSISEMISRAQTTKEAIDGLASSPGHRVILENPKAKYLGVYSAHGTTVIEIATP